VPFPLESQMEPLHPCPKRAPQGCANREHNPARELSPCQRYIETEPKGGPASSPPVSQPWKWPDSHRVPLESPGTVHVFAHGWNDDLIMPPCISGTQSDPCAETQPQAASLSTNSNVNLRRPTAARYLVDQPSWERAWRGHDPDRWRPSHFEVRNHLSCLFLMRERVWADNGIVPRDQPG